MEVLILLAARFLAITNAFARAFDRQNIPIIAPFALADKSAPLVLILVGEARVGAHLYNDNNLVEILVADRERRADKGFKGRARELDSRIFLATIAF